MARWETILRDRVAMLRRGLTKAGYLKGDEQNLAPDDFEALAASVLADLLHLGAADYKVKWSNQPPRTQPPTLGEHSAFIESLLARVAKRASENFIAEIHPNVRF